MADRDTTSQHDSGEPIAAAEPRRPGDHDERRRRLVKGGLAGFPVLMSVFGRPAWAQNCTMSGIMSGNLSDTGGLVLPCEIGEEGCTPGFWKTHLELWHNAYQPEDFFLAAFGVDAFPGATLYQVIMGTAGPNVPSACSTGQGNGNNTPCENALRNLGEQAVAALQNAAGAPAYQMSVQEVVDAFQLAYITGTKEALETQKDEFDTLNNKGCPL